MIEDTIKVKVKEGVLQPACVLLVTIDAKKVLILPTGLRKSLSQAHAFSFAMHITLSFYMSM